MFLWFYLKGEHVENGMRHSVYSCPVALALNENLCEGYYARVTTTKIEIRRGDRDTPVENDKVVETLNPTDDPYVVNFIEDFDNGEDMKIPWIAGMLCELPASQDTKEVWTGEYSTAFEI